jgi:hypothetical protein
VFWFQSIEGAGSYSSNGSLAFGLNYTREISKWLDFETGIDYSIHHIIYEPPFIGDGYDYTPRKETLRIFSVPITLRANFLRFFFINGGATLGFDIAGNNSIDNQTGIGSVLGIGAKYDFRSGLSVYVNPYSKVYPLLPFTLDKYQRTLENGIRIGIMYNIRK